MAVSNFKELFVWKLGKEIVVDVYRLTQTFPRSERFSLTDQMRRSAISIPSNVAEGFNRNARKDFQRFLYIALGSCGELETQLSLSQDLGFLNSPTIELNDKIDHESKMLRSFIARL